VNTSIDDPRVSGGETRVSGSVDLRQAVTAADSTVDGRPPADRDNVNVSIDPSPVADWQREHDNRPARTSAVKSASAESRRPVTP
jgi:hypothetical protein